MNRGGRLDEAGADRGRRRVLTAALCVPAVALGATRPLRIGILTNSTEAQVRAFQPQLVAALRSVGWVVGKDVVVVYRQGVDESSRDGLARELVQESPDVLLTMGTPNTRALQRATRTIPIVTSVENPIASGFAQSLPHPGGNITGLAQGSYLYAEKRVELMKAVIPGLARIAFFTSTGYGVQGLSDEITAPLQSAAARFGASVQFFHVRDLDGFDRAFRAMRGAGTHAAFIAAYDGLVAPAALAALAIERRMPTFHQDPEFVEAGGLIAYSFDYSDETRVVFAIVDKILRGEKPGAIPFELPDRSRLVVNRRTAQALGLRIPAEVLVRADRLVDG
jgi:putative ABC transport system substrate-binding protein